ncbi:pectin lyase-like protein [Punctularia strigosozonata HHB-11173 SS5]|uniref:pectin lyase-like protein n=1 Tax=Punctularia strigosozonata (strain HHB-11173) TaxID=741275 RepID=UPI0004416A52|nr:pectin lyase-like protein [Punctularia strigosozonata HHB-11173 SS5]EIN11435.1 pectin lyase-like protein [Punctularia strigosozonata HHB-11173 SS5]
MLAHLIPALILPLLVLSGHVLHTKDPGYVSGVCTVVPDSDGGDDSAAVIEAFQRCGHAGRVVFPPSQTFHIEQVMNTTGLSDCTVDLHGYLLWGTNITNWLATSLPLGYQNQSSAWFFGGERLRVNGYGTGTLDGNGQLWYDFVQGQSNYPGRPHAITIWKTRDSIFEGLRFVQSQMWTMTIAWSQNVLLQDIYVNSTSDNHVHWERVHQNPARNTDGADTLASDRITFRRWTIDNGDDSIACKANSTNILIEDCTFYRGLGVAMGSIGQYAGIYEYIDGVIARNIEAIRTRYTGYIKTWTGVRQGFPPNGGGGGTGVVQNVVWQNWTLANITDYPVQVTQCTSFSGATGGCDTSTLKIANVSWVNMTGTTASGTVAEIQCSGAAPCENVAIEGVHLAEAGGGDVPALYLCSNVASSIGFNCTGSV